jgi:endonuclease/exonuclease/phosphatase family metal-dependent hydrolase
VFVSRCVTAWVAASLTIGLGAMGGAQNAGQPAPQDKAMPLKVMTFNLRFASLKPPNAWPQRRPVVAECLRVAGPDLIGTQEGVYGQVKDIAADRPEYDWIGVGRDGGSRGEFMAVFYRKERLEPLEFDHFWLSDTPAVVGSKTWGNLYARMVTWVKFRDRPSGREFYFWNTHLDNALQTAREKGVALIVQRTKALNTTLPILLVGDFNAAAKQNKAYDILTGEIQANGGGFTDTWFFAARRVGPNVATFHGYKPPTPDGAHIDWILSRGPVTAEETAVVTCQQNGQYPSDHFPVVATVIIGAPETQLAPAVSLPVPPP